jgi:methylmalonyl-CoA mutase cobalamin-binding subunit
MADNFDRLSRAGSQYSAVADDLIESVVNLVAAKNRRSADTLDALIIARMSIACRSMDPTDLRDLCADLLRDHLSRSQLVDHYIPAVARELGAFWADDEISFSDVTIGTARLQSLLAEFRVPESGEPNAPEIALVVRQQERHTLGAVVAANQLRRLGLNVQLVLGRSDIETANLAGSRDFSAIMISASGGEKVESIRKLVDEIRTQSRTTIVLGGTILDQNMDFCAVAGVDHATADPKEALRLCGLTVPLLDAERRAGSE